MSFAEYKFSSWARRGISSNIAETDTLGASAGEEMERAKVPVNITLNGIGPAITKKFTLVGPGDLTGVIAEMVVRTEPRDGVDDFEPNYLPYIEFYDEDFPWRYTPASTAGPEKLHLRPWLSLVVLKEGEFTDTDRQTPLKSILVNNPAALPPADEAHFWAHMHSNLVTQETNFEKYLETLKEEVKMDPDGVYSRLLCPRKLDPKVMYHAFLVPTFETGRLSGLDRSMIGIKAQQAAWGPNSEMEFPVYYRWSFRTGENFDFESLVKLIEPRVMDKRVGIRPMDCSKPGYFQVNSSEEIAGTNPPTLLLEGAAKAPTAESTTLIINEFQAQIGELVNLNSIQLENPDQDPFVTVPFYGMFHAMRKDLANPGSKKIPHFVGDAQVPTWYDDLNRDPRNRVPAGLGVKAVQDGQEKFMDMAWNQLSDVLEANRKSKQVQLMASILDRSFERNVVKMENEKILSLSRIISSRIIVDGLTVRKQIADSRVPDALFMPGLRKMLRPNTAISRNLAKTATSTSLVKLITETNQNLAITAASIDKFEGLHSIENLVTIKAPDRIKEVEVWSLESNLSTTSIFNEKTYEGGFPAAKNWSRKFDSSIRQQVLVRENNQGLNVPNPPTPERGGIHVQNNNPLQDPPGPPAPPPERVQATFIPNPAYRNAYSEYSSRFGFVDPAVAKKSIDVQSITKKVLENFKPSNAYRRLLDSHITWGPGVVKPVTDFLPAMAYPDFPAPTYKFLVDRDKELILPNLHLIQPNTFSLLRTNQKFIESYLIGLNYEMGRELLWREFPTDMRGTYFRQFWDVKGFVTPETSSKDANDLKDIAPIHQWPLTNELGRNNARDKEGDSEQLVFVVRGDLLKKFPNTVIYAQKAFKKDDKWIINEHMTDLEYKAQVRFPIYQAEIPADIKLLGFDLTIDEAVGNKIVADFPANKEGWFFIIAEVPGEPRFGMDISYKPDKPNVFTWNDLSWENFNGEKLPFVTTKIIPGDLSPTQRFSPPAESRKGKWGRSSADMAAILLQRPVMVAVHASEMLDREIVDQNKGFQDFTRLKVEYINYKRAYNLPILEQ